MLMPDPDVDPTKKVRIQLDPDLQHWLSHFAIYSIFVIFNQISGIWPQQVHSILPCIAGYQYQYPMHRY
jgi:hypothetical protein